MLGRPKTNLSRSESERTNDGFVLGYTPQIYVSESHVGGD